MIRSQSPPFKDSLASLRERKQLIDITWLLILFLTLVIVIPPWFLRLLELDLIPVAWLVFGYGVLYLGVAFLADALPGQRALASAIVALQLFGVAFLGVLWYLLGGLHNPVFLLVFALPVISASATLLRWQPYVVALWSIFIVLGVALLESQELRWYALHLGLPIGPLLDPLPGFVPQRWIELPSQLSPPYIVFLLELFIFLMLAVAMTAESLASLLLRVYGRLRASSTALREAEDLAGRMLNATAQPAVLLSAATYRVVTASETFVQRWCSSLRGPQNKSLLELIDFSHPQVIAEALAAQSGEVARAGYRLAEANRVARVRIHPIEYAGTRYLYVSLDDVSDHYYLQLALDSLDEAFIVIDPSQRLLCFNPSAQQLFAALQVGLEAQIALDVDGLPAGWWRFGLRRKQKRVLRLGAQTYRVRCNKVRVPDVDSALTVLYLHRATVAQEAVA